jgi:hypothetical protein
VTDGRCAEPVRDVLAPFHHDVGSSARGLPEHGHALLLRLELHERSLVLSTAETETNQPAPGGGYTHLQDLTAQQQQLFGTYDTKQHVGSEGGIPFIMIGNRYAWAGASYDPGLLQGLSFDQIANQLEDPGSEVARAIDGSANQITAMVCLLTGNQPAEVCSAPYIRQEQARLIGQ